jgi:hypothetical protein
MNPCCLNCETGSKKDASRNIAFCPHYGLVRCDDLCGDWKACPADGEE